MLDQVQVVVTEENQREFVVGKYPHRCDNVVSNLVVFEANTGQHGLDEGKAAALFDKNLGEVVDLHQMEENCGFAANR